MEKVQLKKRGILGWLSKRKLGILFSSKEPAENSTRKNHFHSILRKNTTINVGSQQKPCLLSSEGNIGFCEGRNYQAGSGSKVILIYYRVFHLKSVKKKWLDVDISQCV